MPGLGAPGSGEVYCTRENTAHRTGIGGCLLPHVSRATSSRAMSPVKLVPEMPKTRMLNVFSVLLTGTMA